MIVRARAIGRSRWSALVVAFLGVAVVAGFVMSPGARADDGSAVTGAVKDAITVDQQATMLPPGFAVGKANTQAQSELRARIAEGYRAHFSGTALTTRLTGLLAWADRVSKAPGDTHLLMFHLNKFDAEQPVISGDSATVTGSYSITEKMGAETTEGKKMTWGGTISAVFTAQASRVDGVWYVSDLAQQQTAYEHDPAFEQGMTGEAAPGAVKSIPPTYLPMVVDPANP